MNDPRAENCRRFAMSEDDKVIGVELAYLPALAARYELVKIELIDEGAAQGQGIANIHVLDKSSLPAQVQCYLAWPWQDWRPTDRFDNRLLPGSANYPYQHVIAGKFNPPNLGPLAICIGDKSGNIIGDVVGGLGLPAGRHVGFNLVYRERAAIKPLNLEAYPPAEDVAAALAALAAQLNDLDRRLSALGQHLGAWS